MSLASPAPSRDPTAEPASPAPSHDPTAEPSDAPSWDPHANLPCDTHAERRPDLPHQEIRVLVKKTLSETQKATRALRLISDQEKKALLTTDLETLLTNQHEELVALAKKHAVKVEYLQKLVKQSPHFKKRRGVTLQNALIHHKAVEVNTDLGHGEKKSMAEIRDLIKVDSTYDNLTKEQEEEMKNEVLSLRELKKKGARTTNRSSAQDYRRVCGDMNDEINALSERTGAVVIAFFSRAHIEDTFEPNWIASENAINFTRDALGHGMWDVARLLEQWACSKAKVRNPDSLKEMQIECSRIINNTLKTVSQVKKAVMNYQNYDMQVIQKFQVKLIGWTYNKLVSPFQIFTIDDVRTLVQALRCGRCHWVRMTAAEVTKHAGEIEVRKAAGETVGKRRKVRSDLGSTKAKRPRKGPPDNDEIEGSGDNGQGPAKKRKTAATRAATTSKRPTAKGKSKARASRRKSQLPPAISDEFIDDSDASAASE